MDLQERQPVAMEETAITVIGAGVVGLAIAAVLSGQSREVIVLEKENTFGGGISSRNSEVIHSGIYYVPGSLKARLCVEGSAKLYAFCEKYSIPHRQCGKFIAAIDDSEIGPLQKLFERANENRAAGVSMIGKKEIKRLEPDLNARAAISAAGSGIVDSHSLMKRLFLLAKGRGALFGFGNEVNFLNKKNNGYEIGLAKGGETFFSRVVINSAGLSSDYVAGLAGMDIAAQGYRLKLCKGSYFYYRKPSPVQRLIYPLPDEELSGLGVHTTLDLTGRLRFGPDVEYVEQIDYGVSESKKAVFYRKAARLINNLQSEAFVPDTAGIRPKLYGPAEKARDFVIAEESGKGFPGLINLIGIESPGLTACLSIADMVSAMVADFLA